MKDCIKHYLSYWEEAYKQELTENIFPFWIEHGIDREHGGYFTCLDRDGTLYDSTKSVWFQGRFAFNLAFAYNQIEPNETWLQLAKSGIDFIEQHCTDQDGRMFFEVMADGTPLRRRRYLFSLLCRKGTGTVPLGSSLQEYSRTVRAEIPAGHDGQRALTLHDPHQYGCPHPGGLAGSGIRQAD